MDRVIKVWIPLNPEARDDEGQPFKVQHLMEYLREEVVKGLDDDPSGPFRRAQVMVSFSETD